MDSQSYWMKFQRARISRRRVLAGSSAGVIGLALAAACGDDGKPSGDGGATPTGEVGTPVRGGTYAEANNGDWGTIDPVTTVAFAPGILPRLYNCLVEQSRIDPDFFYADLADSLPEQPDEETYNYTLRTGVKIAPNTLGIPERDLDSSDAKAWLDRITSDTAAVHRAFTNQYLDTYDAPDATTFQIKTKGPYAYFLLRLGAPLGGTIPPKEFFEQNISLKDQGVGAGPFMIVPGSFKESGVIEMVPNPNYYRTDDRTGEQLPYIGKYQTFRIDDRQAERTAFLSGQVLAYGAETSDEVDEIKAQIPDVELFQDAANTFIAFTMNPDKQPWDKEEIRKAAMFALNRQQYVDIIVGPEGGQIDGLVHWSVAGALPPDELEQLQPFDPEMSKQLIKQATGNDRITIKVMYPISQIEFHDQHLPIWKEQMQAAGFDLDEEPLEFGVWLDRYNNLDYDSSLSLNQIYETAEIPVDFHSKNGPQGDGKFAIGIGKLYPEIQQAIEDTKASVGTEELVQRVQEVQRMLYDKGPAFLPIMTWTAFTLRQPSVKNYPSGIGASGLYLNDWWVEA